MTDGLPVREGEVFQLVAMQAAACDVDEGVDAAVRGDDFFKGRIDRGFFGQVGWKKRRLDAAPAPFAGKLLPGLIV